MADYIDKEKLLAEFDKQSKSADEHGRDFRFCFKSNGVPCTEWDVVTLIVEDFQTEDVKPVVRGKWIEVGEFEQCSVCLGTRLKQIETYYGAVTWIKTNYCPNCGADMREES